MFVYGVYHKRKATHLTFSNWWVRIPPQSHPTARDTSPPVTDKQVT